MSYPIERSSGNVFADLGRSPEEAAVLRFKSRLLSALERYVARFDSQAAAAEALGVSQPRISEIVNGRLSKFTADLLIRYCQRAGIEVTPELHDAEAA